MKTLALLLFFLVNTSDAGWFDFLDNGSKKGQATKEKSGTVVLDGFSSAKHERGYGCYSDTRGDFQKPTINQTLFPNTPASRFWSSSPDAYFRSFAWLLNFNRGFNSPDFRNFGHHVRLVRGRQ